MIQIDIEKSLHGAEGLMDLKVNLKIKKGEFVVLMGESGAGKTTLLRVLAGLEKAKGDVVVEGISWQRVAVQKREIGFVFQDYALFENMSVEENLLFVKNDKKLASELLEITALSTLKGRNVMGLSGGQKQRVALCRAIMKNPKLLLMDEPLSALDNQMKYKLQTEIKVLHERFDMTTIMVSHDLESVFTLASRVLVLDKGIIVKDGSVQEVLKQEKQTYSVKVLSVEIEDTKYIATYSLLGKLLENEVDSTVKVGDSIEISLSSRLISR